MKLRVHQDQRYATVVSNDGLTIPFLPVWLLKTPMIVTAAISMTVLRTSASGISPLHTNIFLMPIKTLGNKKNAISF